MKNIEKGLRENMRQIILLVIVNAFVGGMIGLERTIFPEFAETVFGVSSKAAILSFITAFGITKALTNYFTGRLAGRFGRKKLLVGLGAPFDQWASRTPRVQRWMGDIGAGGKGEILIWR